MIATALHKSNRMEFEIENKRGRLTPLWISIRVIDDGIETSYAPYGRNADDLKGRGGGARQLCTDPL
jgi:hypothetical protein